ncbi:unnamed protein product [Sphenostylis stenocarpa]|uniref:Alcohol dehydrogenase-like C-terminal domain-containing protein n=1 Tax=Sphenostylis stenocarpa TaxID=92480 RepID=A0AA86SD64_9FABA|nr:unnamed protein product [Sphenostylis stenocarpa]
MKKGLPFEIKLRPIEASGIVCVDEDLHILGWNFHSARKSQNYFDSWHVVGIEILLNIPEDEKMIVHPADLCFKLPDNVSLEEGAMCEPLSVGVHACRRANIGPETNVLIMGAGPIGLVTMLAARAFGAPKIVIADVDDHRLSVAKSLGVDGIVEVSTNIQDVDEEVVKIKKVMGAGINVSFDCAGFDKTMSTALGATQRGGKVCLVGMGHSVMTLPLTPAAVREVDVVGVFRYMNTWPLCLEFLRSGKIDVKPLITHRFGFSQKEVEEAFETSARGGNAIKVMFNL